jgi:hypothetical protein
MSEMYGEFPKCELGEYCEDDPKNIPELLPLNYNAWKLWCLLDSTRDYQHVAFQYITSKAGKQVYAFYDESIPKALSASDIKSICDDFEVDSYTRQGIWIIEHEMYPKKLAKLKDKKNGRN